MDEAATLTTTTASARTTCNNYDETFFHRARDVVVAFPPPDDGLLTTRSQFRKKLLALSQHNEDLETHLQMTQRTCLQFREKTVQQEMQIREMEAVVGRLESANRKKGIDDDDEDGVGEETSCSRLLTEKSKQIAELSLKVEDLTLRLQQERGNDDVFLSEPHCSYHQRVCDDDLVQPANHHSHDLESKLEEYRRKCEALERSMASLKHKNAEREIRSAKNFRLMKQQLEFAEGDRNRRMASERALEERVAKLEDDNRRKDEGIFLLRSQLRHLIVSQRTSSAFRQGSDADSVSCGSNTEKWDEKDGSVPPILVAASQDDDTASETESQYDLSEEL
jgi:hypothetical protein